MAATTLTTPAQATVHGCSGTVCIYVNGHSDYVSYAHAQNYQHPYFGHFHLYGVGFSMKSPTQHWRYKSKWQIDVKKYFPDRSVFCAEAWENGRLLGRPCAEIRI
ncbi:hypothetical protein NLX83_03965 [Allokutzneria sp. A3M-2-11 16]|uniref:hypothetical protein n=1 Tax=Allokutzneria sp. A3M-2-11 16 TaxID=2962043 RepID=UPI0020B8908E|nr:hypothetical protein [Allokutzneria sp. A3M-2-11 16]MCP3798409.1 hypothetical protein [Allokutzneria sp. A3M-2-11 16]